MDVSVCDENVKDIAAYDYLTLIVTNDNELYTCGAGHKGQLGNGYITNYYSTPQKVMDNVKKVAAFSNASLVLKMMVLCGHLEVTNLVS